MKNRWITLMVLILICLSACGSTEVANDDVKVEEPSQFKKVSVEKELISNNIITNKDIETEVDKDKANKSVQDNNKEDKKEIEQKKETINNTIKGESNKKDNVNVEKKEQKKEIKKEEKKKEQTADKKEQTNNEDKKTTSSQKSNQPTYQPSTIYFNGVAVPYKNGGKEKGQAIIDGGVYASTWGGTKVFNANDGMNTHFIGHNPGVFSGIWNAKSFIITDENGSPYTYIVTSVYKVNKRAIGVDDGVDYWDRITGTGGGERVTFQTCVSVGGSTNWIIEAIKKE